MVGIQWGVYGLAVATASVAGHPNPGSDVLHLGDVCARSDVLSAAARPVAATVSGVVAGFLVLPHITMPDSNLLALAGLTSTLGLVYLGTFAVTPGGISRLKSLRHTIGLLRKQPDETPSAA